jgi:hypothetical protein
MEALQACAASHGGKQTMQMQWRSSPAARRIILVAEVETFVLLGE